VNAVCVLLLVVFPKISLSLSPSLSRSISRIERRKEKEKEEFGYDEDKRERGLKAGV